MIVGHIGGGASEGAPVDVGHSVRLRAAVYAYFFRVPSAAGNRKKFTFSIWLKRSTLSTLYGILGTGGSVAADIFSLRFTSSDTIQLIDGTSSASSLTSTGSKSIWRDPFGWMHVVLAYDTDNATDTLRQRIWVNNNLLSLTGTYLAQGTNSLMNNNVFTAIGANYVPGTGTLNHLDANIARCEFVDGQALDPSYFGTTDSNGEWVPRTYVGAYGTNGWKLDFETGTNLTTLASDSSGNGNNFGASAVSLTAGATYDWSLDSPTDNYCVLSNINRTGTDISAQYGGLRVVKASATPAPRIHGNFGMDTGKWYFEYDVVAVAGGGNYYMLVGLLGGDFASSAQDRYLLFTSNDATLAGDLQIWAGGSGSNSNYGSNPGAGSWVGVEYDADNNQIEFFLNGTSQGLKTGVQNRIWFPGMIIDGTTNSGTVDFNFGQRPWHRTPTTGFKALSTKNIASAGSVTASGSFQGNLNAEGPVVFLNGVPTAMTINGNAVTFGTHADKLASGIKVRSSSSSYNNTGSNTFSVTSSGAAFKNARGQGNP